LMDATKIEQKSKGNWREQDKRKENDGDDGERKNREPKRAHILSYFVCFFFPLPLLTPKAKSVGWGQKLQVGRWHIAMDITIVGILIALKVAAVTSRAWRHRWVAASRWCPRGERFLDSITAIFGAL